MTANLRTRRLWTAEEDRILRSEATKQLATGPLNNWRSIAAKLPSRTNKDCRKRWSKVSHNVNHGAWDPAEDKRLLAGVETFNSSWTQVATVVRTRHADQCAKRWKHSLDPSLDHSKWQADDDEKLQQSVAVHGRNWKLIAERDLPSRSMTDLKNRFGILERKALAVEADLPSSPMSLSPELSDAAAESTEESDVQDFKEITITSKTDRLCESDYKHGCEFPRESQHQNVCALIETKSQPNNTQCPDRGQQGSSFPCKTAARAIYSKADGNGQPTRKERYHADHHASQEQIDSAKHYMTPDNADVGLDLVRAFDDANGSLLLPQTSYHLSEQHNSTELHYPPQLQMHSLSHTPDVQSELAMHNWISDSDADQLDNMVCDSAMFSFHDLDLGLAGDPVYSVYDIDSIEACGALTSTSTADSDIFWNSDMVTETNSEADSGILSDMDNPMQLFTREDSSRLEMMGATQQSELPAGVNWAGLQRQTTTSDSSPSTCSAVEVARRLGGLTSRTTIVIDDVRQDTLRSVLDTLYNDKTKLTMEVAQ